MLSTVYRLWTSSVHAGGTRRNTESFSGCRPDIGTAATWNYGNEGDVGVYGYRNPIQLLKLGCRFSELFL